MADPERITGPFSRSGGAPTSSPSSSTTLVHGGWRSRPRPEPLIFAGRHLQKGWKVMDRLDEMTVPTLVMAGRDDFVFPLECQQELAGGIPGAQLVLVDHAGHNPQDEQTAEVMAALRRFISSSNAQAA